MLTKEEQYKLWRRIAEKLAVKDELQAGQTMYNALYHIKPEATLTIGGTNADPFYNDDNIGRFINTIRPK